MLGGIRERVGHGPGPPGGPPAPCYCSTANARCSGDGGKILAKFGIRDPESGRIVYRWHTFRLDPQRIPGEGLTITNVREHREE